MKQIDAGLIIFSMSGLGYEAVKFSITAAYICLI